MFPIVLSLILIISENVFATYHSQEPAFQDKYLNENFFHDKERGVFVDIGAYDGRTISNSLFFEEERGWTGICIEPLPDTFLRLKQNRKCICINCCVSNINGEVDFIKVNSPKIGVADMLSGIQLDPNRLVDLQKFIAENGGTIEIIKVPSRTLNEILDQYNIHKIDMLSIDTEGAELLILQSLDYSKNHIHLMAIENPNHDSTITEFLKSKGFTLVTTLAWDEVYQNTHWDDT